MPPETPKTPAEPATPRWVDRHRSLVAALVVMFSMFSPAVDLRPKPLLPAQYEMAEPADPPDLDLNQMKAESAQKSGTAATEEGAAASGASRPLPAGSHPFKSEKARKRYLAFYDARAHHWPVPSVTQMIAGDFGDTLVRISGPADAPPLVLLHGISSNSLTWMPNIQALSARYRVYAVDHIFDFGRSVYHRPLRSAADHLAWLDGLFDSLGLSNGVRLVGLSYGGWLAARYAQHAPQRLAGVVLLAPVCTVLPLAAGWIARAVSCLLPHPWFTRNFMRWLLPDLAAQGGPPGSTFDEVANEALLALRSFKSRRLVPANVFSDAELAAIKVPALFMVGVNEKIYSPLKACERLGSAAPQIQTLLLADAGHDLSVVRADRVNAEILRFFGTAGQG
jgi:pimeloyl-ACP methyl ester carboxylesterase